MELIETRKELELAGKELQLMKSCEIKDFEDHWIKFLHYIERVWYKSLAECSDIENKFQPWNGKNVKLRRKDPLLRYITTARGVEEHTVMPIVKKKLQMDSKLGSGPTGVNIINSFMIGTGNNYIYDGAPGGLTVDPAYVRCLSCYNRGNWVLIPLYHLNKRLHNPDSAVEIATKAHEFYSQYLNSIEEKF